MLALWQRFRRAYDSRYAKEPSCFGCPYGESFTWNSPRNRGSVTEFRPKKGDGPCEKCFEDWVSDKMDEGKICTACRGWIKKLGMDVKIEYIDGRVKHNAMCDTCATEFIERVGKEVDGGGLLRGRRPISTR